MFRVVVQATDRIETYAIDFDDVRVDVAGDGDDDLVRRLASRDESAVAASEATLRLVGDSEHSLRLILTARAKLRTDAGCVAVLPGRLNERASAAAVSRLGELSAMRRVAAGVQRRNPRLGRLASALRGA